MKMAALDIGDVWTGSALSDPLGITTRPYKTVKTKDLFQFINQLTREERIGTIVVGYPKTMKGTESDQTRKTVIMFKKLQQSFPAIDWQWWDERLTSKQAAHMKKQKNKQDKLMEHSIAAALLLMGYLAYKNHE